MALIPTRLGDMDETALVKLEDRIDNAHECTTIVEYCLKGCEGPAHRTGIPDAPSYFCSQHVHRSAAVSLKEWPEGLAAVLGEFC